MAQTMIESVRGEKNVDGAGGGGGGGGPVLFVFPEYSGVTRRPAVSARLCCHSASRLPPSTPLSLAVLSILLSEFPETWILSVTIKENHPPPITQSCPRPCLAQSSQPC